jgi:hypothetical protein
MKTPVKVIAAAGALAMATAAGFGLGMAQADQPHMRNALGDLQAARGELQVAADNKGGHRVAAIQLIDQAIDQVHQGMDVGAGY